MLLVLVVVGLEGGGGGLFAVVLRIVCGGVGVGWL